MNKTNKTLEFIKRKDVKLFLIKLAGEKAPEIMSHMSEPISDEEIAERVGMRAADVRMILNKLHYYEVIDYNRTKDKDSGWYYYYWFIRPDKLYNAYIDQKKRDLEDLEEKIENSEVHAVYICKHCEQTYDFDRAAELLYHCPICERILDLGITEDDLKKMEKIAQTIRKELTIVQGKFSDLKEMKTESMKVL